MRSKYIIGGAIILIFTVWAAISFKSTLTPYVSIQEAKSNGGTVQVKGKRVNSGNFDIQNSVFKFKLRDDSGEIIEVVYDGAKPGNFDQATEVVCVGSYRDGKFQAKNILVKCPSKYQEEGAQL